MYLPIELNIYDKFSSKFNLNLNNSKFSFDRYLFITTIVINLRDFIYFKDDTITSDICQDFFDESLFKKDKIVYNTFDVENQVNDNLEVIDNLFIDIIEL